jgi:RNA polymerase sigma factor (sigma-70 family)
MSDQPSCARPPSAAIVLDSAGLRAGLRSEWDKAYRLARIFAHRYVDRMGGDVDDLIQEAIARLAAELDALAAKGVAPAAALLRTFYCQTMKEQRRRHRHRGLAERLPGEPVPSPPRPDDQYADHEVSDAIDRVLRDELASGAPLDRAILEGILAGLNNRTIAGIVGRSVATVCERLQAIIKRLQQRLRALLGVRP